MTRKTLSHDKKEEVQKLFKGFNLLKAQDPPPEAPEEKAEEKTVEKNWNLDMSHSLDSFLWAIEFKFDVFGAIWD